MYERIAHSILYTTPNCVYLVQNDVFRRGFLRLISEWIQGRRRSMKLSFLETLISEGCILTEREYGKLVQRMSPGSPMWKDCLNAFWIGGLICTLGQIFMNWYGSMGLDKTAAGTATSASLVVISAILTGLSLYDDIAKVGGAGTLVPITGFANSIAAPAVEFQTEGYVLGVAAKMFTIAGPVLVYGISASVVYGFIYWLIGVFSGAA